MNIFSSDELNAIHQAVDEAFKARMAYIEAHRARLVEAFIAETGLNPSNAVLCVEQNAPGGFRIWYRAKTEKEMAGECEDLTQHPEL